MSNQYQKTLKILLDFFLEADDSLLAESLMIDQKTTVAMSWSWSDLYGYVLGLEGAPRRDDVHEETVCLMRETWEKEQQSFNLCEGSWIVYLSKSFHKKLEPG